MSDFEESFDRLAEGAERARLAFEAFAAAWAEAGDRERQAMQERLDALPLAFVAELMRRDAEGGQHG